PAGERRGGAGRSSRRPSGRRLRDRVRGGDALTAYPGAAARRAGQGGRLPQGRGGRRRVRGILRRPGLPGPVARGVLGHPASGEIGPGMVEPRTGAVFLPNWVGDAVMATPALRALRQRFPAARIVGVLKPYVAGVLEGTGWLDDLVFLDRRGPSAHR